MLSATVQRCCPHCGRTTNHDLMNDCGDEVAWCHDCRRVHLTDPDREAASVVALAAALSAFMHNAVHWRSRLSGMRPN